MSVHVGSLPEGVEFVAEEEGVREFRLANGLKLLLVENRVAPVATFLVLYRVGSRNEAVGHTGATHLLEHMLFKGTPTFNKAKGHAGRRHAPARRRRLQRDHLVRPHQLLRDRAVGRA